LALGFPKKNSNETKSFVIEENRPVTRQSFQHESSHSFDWFQTCEPTIYEQNHILINCTLYHHPKCDHCFYWYRTCIWIL